MSLELSVKMPDIELSTPITSNDKVLGIDENGDTKLFNLGEITDKNLLTKASALEATTGDNDVKYMTPLTTKAAVLNNKASQTEANAGTNDVKFMTPKTTQASIINFGTLPYKGIIPSADFDPGTPANAVLYQAQIGTTYTKFKDASGNAITVTQPATGNPVITAFITVNGAVSALTTSTADLTTLATKSSLIDKTSFVSYTSTSGVRNNAFGQPFIIGTSILEDGFIKLGTFYSTGATTLKLQVVTKNTADTGFTATGVESATVTVVNGLNTDISFNLPVLKGQYIKLIANGSFGLSVSNARGGYYSNDNFATTTYRSDFDACFNFTVYKNVASVTQELFNENLFANITEDEVLLRRAQYVFQKGALAETHDKDMNAAAILIPVPVGKYGVLSKLTSIMSNADLPSFRLIIVDLDEDLKYRISKYVDITALTTDLKPLGITIQKNQFIFIDLQHFGHPMKTCTTSLLGYGSEYFNMPTSYEVGTEVTRFNSNFFTSNTMAMELTIDVLPEVAEVNPPKRVSLFKDNFATTRPIWINGNNSWVFDNANKKVTSGATGKDNYLNLNIPYYNDQREGNYILTLDTSGTIARFVTGFGQEGNTVFDLNGITNTLNIYQYDPQSSGTTVVASTAVPLVIGRKYKLVQTKRDVTTIINVIDTVTGLSYSVQGVYSNANDGKDVGRQNDNYQLFAQAGQVTLYGLEVNAPYRPFLAFDEDSIGEGVYVNPPSLTHTRLIRENILAQRGFADETVVLLCRGGQTIGGTIENFKRDYRYTRPRKLSVKQGTNQGGYTEQFAHIGRLCEAYGIELYLNHIPCLANGNHVQVNANIDASGYFNGVRYDLATALNYDLTQGYDAPNMGDMVHPNATGQAKMAARIVIDCPKMLS